MFDIAQKPSIFRALWRIYICVMRERSRRYLLLDGYESPILDGQNAFIHTPVQEVSAFLPGPLIKIFTC